VTSAFIIQVQPQLQSDPNEETTALLRVLIYKIDSTMFGDNIPLIPQWSGPPHAIVQVQAILYASLAASLFSAFLAMLGKQWLNRYTSIDMRGSAIERSQNRQRKLDGIVTWYFDTVMESLPLMLQFALLLLGCALSRYLWEINTTVASVVIGVTSFGVASYAFFIIAGTASISCPYQTPGAHTLRRIPPLALSALRSAFPHSYTVRKVGTWQSTVTNNFGYSVKCIALSSATILVSPIFLLGCLAVDIYLLGRATVRTSVANAPGWFHWARGWDPQTATLDLRCISWMVQTSLDKTVRLSTLRLLATVTTMGNFDPALVSVCFDIFTGCVSIINGKVVVLQESEELAALSVLCCLRALSHPTTMGPASGVFEDMRRQYIKTFPIDTNFKDLPYSHCFWMIHNIFHPSMDPIRDFFPRRRPRRPKIQWSDHELSGTEHLALAELGRFEHRRKRSQKVPRWILRYAHHLLSQDPLPSASAITDCLSIVATDLGCTVPNTTTSDERYVPVSYKYPPFLPRTSAWLNEVSNLIAEELEKMAWVGDLDQIESKHKAIIVLLPYLVWGEQVGDRRMTDAFLGVVRVQNVGEFMAQPIARLLGEAGPDFPNRVMTLMSPHADWWRRGPNANTVTRWAEAALAVPYSEEICQSVVDTLLQIASNGHLEPFIPVSMWAWLKKRPSLPPICYGRKKGAWGCVVRRVRELGDVEILESYFLLVWSEWNHIYVGLPEMYASIRKDLGGIGMGRHREVLIKRLDHILEQLDMGLGHLQEQNPLLGGDHILEAREQYRELKGMLLKADREALEVLTSKPFRIN